MNNYVYLLREVCLNDTNNYILYYNDHDDVVNYVYHAYVLLRNIFLFLFYILY